MTWQSDKLPLRSWISIPTRKSCCRSRIISTLKERISIYWWFGEGYVIGEFFGERTSESNLVACSQPNTCELILFFVSRLSVLPHISTGCGIVFILRG